MKNFQDVLTTSPGSASAISNSLKEYGGGMWEGIGELVLEAYGEGVKDGFVKAFGAGLRKGFIEGSIASISMLVFVRSILREIEQCYKYTKRKEVIDNELVVGNTYC